MADHHRFILAKQLGQIDFLDEQIKAISHEISQHLARMDHPSSSGDEEQAKSIDPQTGELIDDTACLSWQVAVPLLDIMPGVDQRTTEVMVAEMGLDMSQLPTPDDLTSWAGLAV